MSETSPGAEAVEAYLRCHPGFLRERQQLFALLEPPCRVHGDGLADHMTAMVAAARTREASMAQRADEVLAASRAAAGIAERVQEAVLALLHADDLAECVSETWPGLLGVDAAALCCEGASPCCEKDRSRWRELPQGAVRGLMCGRQMVFRDRPADAAMLHAEAAMLAERDMLLLLPATRCPALLALVSRDPATLPAVQSWSFLGRVLARLCEAQAVP